MTSTSTKPPFLAMTAAKKGGVGKTHLMATVADLLALNACPFVAFQADDKKRLSTLIGAKVTDLRPNPDQVMHDPALLRKSFTPLYTAASKARCDGHSVLFDIGADEVENAANFLKEVDIDEDLVAWKLPALVFVLVQAETDAIASAAETIRRFREAMPSGRIVLVENLLDRGPLEASFKATESRNQAKSEWVFQRPVNGPAAAADFAADIVAPSDQSFWSDTARLMLTDTVCSLAPGKAEAMDRVGSPRCGVVGSQRSASAHRSARPECEPVVEEW